MLNSIQKVRLLINFDVYFDGIVYLLLNWLHNCFNFMWFCFHSTFCDIRVDYVHNQGKVVAESHDVRAATEKIWCYWSHAQNVKIADDHLMEPKCIPAGCGVGVERNKHIEWQRPIWRFTFADWHRINGVSQKRRKYHCNWYNEKTKNRLGKFSANLLIIPINFMNNVILDWQKKSKTKETHWVQRIQRFFLKFLSNLHPRCSAAGDVTVLPSSCWVQQKWTYPCTECLQWRYLPIESHS